MCANHSTTRAILLTGWDSNPRWNIFTGLTVRTVRPTTATRQYLPHFTGLMDRLPYGSGGFLLFQDSVVPQGIEPYPQDFQSCVQTTYTREPIMIMLEYPSRSNLNCLIVVLRGLGRKGDEFLNLSWIVDIREIEKTIIIGGK